MSIFKHRNIGLVLSDKKMSFLRGGEKVSIIESKETPIDKNVNR